MSQIQYQRLNVLKKSTISKALKRSKILFKTVQYLY